MVVQSLAWQLLQRMVAPAAVDVLVQAGQATLHQQHPAKEAMGEADRPLLLLQVVAVAVAHPLLAVPALVQMGEMAVTARPQLLAAAALLTLVVAAAALEMAALLELEEQAAAAQAAQAQQQELPAQPTQAVAVAVAAQILVASEEMVEQAAQVS